MKEGKPENPEKYLLVEADNTKVYLDKEIEFKRKVAKMDLRKFFLTHEITIDGVDITY